jgi:hypothetical protein
VFLRCVRTQCATLEGGDRSLFEKLTNELHWEALPGKAAEKTTPVRRAIHGSGVQTDAAPSPTPPLTRGDSIRAMLRLGGASDGENR